MQYLFLFGFGSYVVLVAVMHPRVAIYINARVRMA